MTGQTSTYRYPARPLPAVRRIGVSDLWDALGKGFRDFEANPSFGVLTSLIVPICGLVLGRMVLGYDMLPLLFPLVAGFALLGPLAGVVFYEVSRRRERGLPVTWGDAFGVLRSPSIGSILILGLALTALFVGWLVAAETIYVSLFGDKTPASVGDFLQQVFRTPEGWTLILVGNAVGFLFAVLAFAISVVSFPLLVEKDVGAAGAVVTSVRAVLANPVTMAVWGLIVAAALVIGTLPLFVGLAVVVPLFGHATWHLYRKVVA